MRHFFFTIVFGLWALSPLQAQEAEIEANIRAQIEAFKADDFATAFEFASPTIQGIFQSPENFGVMVRRGYPMVWRPEALRFLELRDVAGNLWQRVMITDANGRAHLLDYQMVKLEGRWKINAVQLLKVPGVST